MSTEFLMPTTPVQGPTTDLPDDVEPPVHDLSVGALGEHDAGPYTQQTAARRFAASIASSLASQYDPSSTGSEKQMLQDVSGISTPTGTPKAARRDLEGSMRGDGSVQGEGSARGDGSVAGDMDDLSSRLEGLTGHLMDRDEPGETPREEFIPDLAGPGIKIDANEASDLDALEPGDVEREIPASGTYTGREALTNHGEGGVAGHLLPDIGSRDEIEPPFSQSSKFHEDFDRNVPAASAVARETPMAPYEATVEDPKTAKNPTKWLGARYEYISAGEGGLRESEGEGRSDEASGVRYHTALADSYEKHSSDDIQDEKQIAAKQNTIDAEQINKYEDKDESTSAEAPQRDEGDAEAKFHAQVLQADEPGFQLVKSETAKKPLQVQIEPAPIAQPLDEEAVEPYRTDESLKASPMQVDEEGISNDTATLELPSVPRTELDSLSPTAQGYQSRSPSLTPIDASILRSFPDVPDEEKPRVEVHVSSPQNTPQKGRSGSLGTNQETPIAYLPGHSKSLSGPPAEAMGTPGNFPNQTGELDNDATPQTAKQLTKRLSTRRSPKSPLLDDEDPGDYEPGEEGWAMVTQ